MVHSHHSHSSSFCCHASSPIEEMVQTAIDKNFKIFCLTEHVPRLNAQYIYPEESHLSVEQLAQTFDDYIIRAREIQKLNNSTSDNGMKILVGFESEGGINDDHLDMCLKYKSQYHVDLVIGSVHHVQGIPIDFDQAEWNRALDVVGKGDISELYYHYFKTVSNMITKLKPEVVAHFDLIRLLTPKHSALPNLADFPEIWKVIEDAVDKIVESDLLVELNSSAIRKGWPTPYPQEDVFALMVEKGVKFCLSDDSHKSDQIGLNYDKVLAYLNKHGVASIWYFDVDSNGHVTRAHTGVQDLQNFVMSSASKKECV